MKLGPTGTYPKGRLGPRDEGALRMAVASDPANGVVVVQFGKKIKWFALDRESAISLANLILHHAGNLN